MFPEDSQEPSRSRDGCTTFSVSSMEGHESFLLISEGTASGSSVTRKMQPPSFRGSMKWSSEGEAEGRLMVRGEKPDHPEEL